MTTTDKRTPQKDTASPSYGHGSIQNDILLIKSSYTALNRNEELHTSALKSERILAAVYLITNHIDSADRLRTELRSVASELVSGLWKSLGHTGSNYVESLAHARRVIDVLTAQLRAAAMSRIISETNALIVERECVSMHRTIVRLESRAGVHDVHTPDHHITQDITRMFSQKSSPTPISDTLHSGVAANHFLNTAHPLRSGGVVPGVSAEKNIGNSVSGKPNGSLDFAMRLDTENTSNQIRQKAQDLKDNQNDIKTTLDQAKRLHKILNVITDKKTVSIKDITDTVTGYSEKSVQRDLTILISKGLIKRTGNKRWSRYEIVG